jgi:hypothetical protein
VIVAKQHRGRSEKRNGLISFGLSDRTSCGFIAKPLPRPVVFVLTTLCRVATQQHVAEARYTYGGGTSCEKSGGATRRRHPPDTTPLRPSLELTRGRERMRPAVDRLLDQRPRRGQPCGP